MNLSNDWKDYELIDASCGEKYERWGNIYLLRPDPQVVWDNGNLREKYHGKIDAVYHRSNKGGGHWENLRNVPAAWTINYKNLTFNIKQMGFKHTGLFPEQAVNWDFMMEKITKSGRKIKVLNLFAYTGGATVACAYAGASVCHVDSSKGMTAWAKENITSSELQDKPVRFIIDDVIKFVQREIRRGNKYDAIVMDPPSYGRGANGEVWNIEDSLYTLVELCTKVLSDKPLFFIINSYTTGLAPTILANILNMLIKQKGKVTSGEIGLPMKDSRIILPCGIYGRWEE